MEWRGTTRWIGPRSIVRPTIERRRVWRWSEDDYAVLEPWWHPGDDDREQRRRRTDIAGGAPGFLQPGLALFDTSGRPVCALGRHARARRELARVEQALLVPREQGPYRGAAETGFRVGGTCVSANEGDMVVCDEGGLERARAAPARGWLSSVLALNGKTLTLGTQALRVTETRETLLRGTSVLRLVDPRLGTPCAEARSDGRRSTEGDVTHPVHVRWKQAPDVWGHAALLVLLALWIDYAYPGEADGVVFPAG